MKTKYLIILLIFFTIYISIVLLTDYSLVGFWTDIIFSIFLSIFSLRIAFKNNEKIKSVNYSLKTLSIILSTIFFGLIAYSFSNIFILDTFKLRSFYFQKVEGRIFHAYFKPMGSYSGGYGNFWINESPIYFPIIEKRVYYERTVQWDFGSDEFDGEPVDNYKEVKIYIKDNIINNQK